MTSHIWIANNYFDCRLERSVYNYVMPVPPPPSMDVTLKQARQKAQEFADQQQIIAKKAQLPPRHRDVVAARKLLSEALSAQVHLSPSNSLAARYT